MVIILSSSLLNIIPSTLSVIHLECDSLELLIEGNCKMFCSVPKQRIWLKVLLLLSNNAVGVGCDVLKSALKSNWLCDIAMAI